MDFDWITSDTIVEKTHQYYNNLIPLWEKFIQPAHLIFVCPNIF